MPDLLYLTTEQWIDFWTGVATVILGLAAIVGTRAAVTLTREANAREEKRDQQQDRDRVDRWLAEFVVAATDYRIECADWVEEVGGMEEHWGGDPDEMPIPRKPSSGAMQARIDAARLVARGKERDDLERLSLHLQYVRGVDVPKRGPLVQDAIIAVREWRSSEDPTSRLSGAIVGPYNGSL